MAAARINAAVSRLNLVDMCEFLEDPARDEYDPGVEV
jgi:hypothetical protein